MLSAFVLVEKTFSTYRQFEPEGKLARMGTATGVSGGITIFTADGIFLSCSQNLVLRLNLWFFRWVNLAEEFRMRSLNSCPSLSKNGSETEQVFWFKGILGVVDKSLLEKEGSKERSTLKELVSNEFESKGWVFSAPKVRLIPSVPSRPDVSSNDSKLGLLGWLRRSECWRGLPKSCWSPPSSESDSNS